MAPKGPSLARVRAHFLSLNRMLFVATGTPLPTTVCRRPFASPGVKDNEVIGHSTVAFGLRNVVIPFLLLAACHSRHTHIHHGSRGIVGPVSHGMRRLYAVQRVARTGYKEGVRSLTDVPFCRKKQQRQQQQQKQRAAIAVVCET